jgi:hypothetical protein
MPDKKISALDNRTPALTDLTIVGDPLTGYSYKNTWGEVLAMGVRSFNTRVGDVVTTTPEFAFTVGAGGGAPGDGDTTFTDATLGGLVICFRNGLIQEKSNPGNGDTYITVSGTTVTFSTALGAGERIYIICIIL